LFVNGRASAPNGFRQEDQAFALTAPAPGKQASSDNDQPADPLHRGVMSAIRVVHWLCRAGTGQPITTPLNGQPRKRRVTV
jgi:hypothetical protein